MSLKQLLLALSLLLTVTACNTPNGSHARPIDGTLNCDDFNSQADAQAYYDTGAYDAQNLDGDGDGIACEGL